MKIINVILTGGVGSRLWPLSRQKQPKQYLNLFEGRSLFQHTVLRNQHFCDALQIVGNIENYELSRRDLQQLGLPKYAEIIEATPRNTAAAIAFAALNAQAEDILLVTPSDHLIDDLPAYEKSLQEALQLAQAGALVTFGLAPDKPETGFGYLQIEGHEVLSFREKPNAETAQEFIKSGDFYWNSGMFCFQAQVFLQELQKYEPKVYQTAKAAFESKDAEGKLNLKHSMEIPSISVDYAVMERSKNIKAVIGNFKWSDMGSFESVYEYLKTKGQPIDSEGNMVIGSDLHTEFLGLKNCILVLTEDAILVLKKDRAQDVKKIYEEIQHKNPSLM